MIIKRIVNGTLHEFELTPAEISAVYDEGRIEDAKNVLELHQLDFDEDDYERVMGDEKILLELGTRLEEALTDDNGDIEYKVLSQFIKYAD